MARLRVALPADASATTGRAGPVLVVRAVFPTAAHLSDAARATIMVALGILVAMITSQARHPPAASFVAWLGPLAPAASLLALLLALRGLVMARRIRPIELRFDRLGLTASAPPGVPMRPTDQSARAFPRGGNFAIAWSAVERVERSRDGLTVYGHGEQALLIPWRYRRRSGLMGIKLGLSGSDPHAAPAFRFNELDWLMAVIERFREGDAGALDDLEGWLPASAPPLAPLPETSPFRLRGVTPERLRIAVVVLGAALAFLATAGMLTPPKL